MPHRIRQKCRRIRFRRLAAAFAGAAMISSMMLPGIPMAKAYAASQNNTNNPFTTSQQEKCDPIVPETNLGATDPANTTPESTALNQPGTPLPPSTELSTNNNPTATPPVNPTDSRVGDPVQVVTADAATFGFDSAGGRFSLLSQTDTNATVRVHSEGKTFHVDLTRQDGSWVITTIRGIGNSKTPATFIPASMFQNQNVVPTPAIPNINEQVLYQTDNFSQWSWKDSAYPADMTFGVLLQNPAAGAVVNIVPVIAAATPGYVLDQLSTVDFSRQFLLYSHLGTTASSGYGIGIAKIVQTGNDIIVTVRTKSPEPNQTLAATKGDDSILMDRTTLDFGRTIHVAFVDQNGATLSSYTINPS